MANLATDFVFIVLELCRKKSLMELHKRRGSLTEPEVRYYMKQLSEVRVHYLEIKICYNFISLNKTRILLS